MKINGVTGEEKKKPLSNMKKGGTRGKRDKINI